MLVNNVTVWIHTVRLVHAVMLVYIVVLGSSIVVEIGAGDAIVANVVTVMLAVAVSSEVRFHELRCCRKCWWSDGLNRSREGRLEMIPVAWNGEGSIRNP